MTIQSPKVRAPSRQARLDEVRRTHYNSSQFADLLKISVPTLRNYIYFARNASARKKQGQQVSPINLPLPKRKSGELFWEKDVVDEWISKKHGA